MLACSRTVTWYRHRLSTRAGKLLGRITIDDVVDVIRDEADHSLMSMAGLDEEDDIFAPVHYQRPAPRCLAGHQPGTAFLASWVIGLYETTLQQVVALAVLMPIVASMGGIAGSQTLTIMIRGLALGQVGPDQCAHIDDQGSPGQYHERGHLGNGRCGDRQRLVPEHEIGAIIAAALMINLICAALAGFSIPLALKRMGIDPALAGSVLLTTVTDVVGFMAFLGLGTWYLL